MITSWTLDNQARLVVEKIPYLKSIALGVFVKVGSRHESKSLAGVSHFVEHMIFKGTSKLSSRDIAESFERMGGQLNAFTSKEFTCVYARTLDEDIYKAIDIIFDMIFDAKFDSKDMQVEKEVVLEEINMYEDTPDELIHDVFNQKLWQSDSMGSPILGTTASVSDFERDSVFDFYKKYYTAENMIIAIAGNADEQEIVDYLNRNIAKHRGTSPPESAANKGIDYTPFVHTVAKDIEQVQLCVGVTGVSYYDERRYTLNVLNSILGGGMSSRLFQNIREELGLAYSVYSAHSSYSDTGAFSIFIGTSPNKVDKFFEALHEQFSAFVSKGITEDELQRTRNLIKSSTYLSLESVINRMNRIGKSYLMYDKVVPVDDVIEKIMKVDREMVQELAQELLSDQKISLAAIGASHILPLVENSFAKYWRN